MLRFSLAGPLALALLGCSPAVSSPAAPPTQQPCPKEPEVECELTYEVREGFKRGDFILSKLDVEKAVELIERAEAERSTSLIIIVDGALVYEEYFGTDPERPTIAMSTSKSVVALAIGKLVDDGLIDLDAHLGDSLVPEWKGSPKAAITVRQMLRQMSGLSVERYAETEAGRKHGSIERHGLASELVSEPGTTWAYNNNISDFLGVIVQRANPEHLFVDDYLRVALFSQLEFGPTFWIRDKLGQPRAAGELFARPIDLAKLGQLVLDEGQWHGEQLLSKAWIADMLSPAPGAEFYGSLWWRRGDAEKVLAYAANGYLGQHIVVVPDARIVAVRTRDPRVSGDNPDEFGYSDFVWDVLAMAGHEIAKDDRNRFAAPRTE